MKYTVLFEDNEEHAAKRAEFMEAHLCFLESNSDRILAAGPLRDAGSGGAAGGLWVVETPDAEDVHDLIRKDPFWPTGLRKSYRVLAWREVFRDGRRATG